MEISGIGNPPARPLHVVIYLVGVVGAAASLTVLFLGMRAVMDVGGFCAEGGPYVIQTACPPGVSLLLTLAVFVLLGSCGLVGTMGARLGPPYGSLVGLVWPALFLSLGWNFLQYGVINATDGIVWGWLIPGVLFVLMGVAPLVLGSPFGHSGRAGAARRNMAAHVAPAGGASAGWSIWPSGDMAELRRGNSRVVNGLERLARLHAAGALTDAEFEAAKAALLAEPE